jgi:uncharacterized protein
MRSQSVRVTWRDLAGGVVACVVAGLFWVTATRFSPQATPLTFEVRDVMIPMRDGIRLHTVIFTPATRIARLPILLNRTPYGVSADSAILRRGYRELVNDGYIFAFQDLRGRFRSEGTFVMMRPLHADAKQGVDESTDAFDTIEWLVRHVDGNNGRVGILGVSYDGWTAATALVRPHPALRAASPQAAPADMWMGDDFHHQGAFRLSYGFEYASMMESASQREQFAFDRYDTYDWYLALGSLAAVNEHVLQRRVPSWNDFEAHPDYDEFWRRRSLAPQLTRTSVPTLNVAGWWDQEDFRGPLAIYRALERRDDRGVNFLVVGPWNHGGWRGDGRRLGAIEFGSATGDYYRASVEARFFAHYLKDVGTPPSSEALTFEAGANLWRQWKTWPPADRTSSRKLYLDADHRLSFAAPASATQGAVAYDSFVSDPEHPVPYRQRPIQSTYFPGGSGWYTWQAEDQRFVDDRPDVLSWETAPLTADLSIAGQIKATIYASTSGTDADWVVKLIDVYPEAYPQNWLLAGYQLMIAGDVLRGRYRESFEHPQPLPPDTVMPFTIDLQAQNYRFRPGHRLMVQIQSTWFPLIDRNPQTYVPNIFLARPSDFRPATHRIWRSAQYPSAIDLPVVMVRGSEGRTGR